MNNNFTTKNVPLKKLRNDALNPRHPELGSQIEIIAWTMEQYGREIHNLATDILQHGLSPIERILAVPSDTDEGCYVVVEGNRRLTAIRLIDNPDLSPTRIWCRKFEKLAKTHADAILHVVPITIAPDRNAVRWILDRRHRGEDEGRGLKRWNAQQAARAERLRQGKNTRYDRAINVIDYAIDRKLLGPNSAELEGPKFPITTLERLLADAVFANSLGISFSDRELYLNVEVEDANKALVRVLGDLANGLSVTKVKNFELRQKYLSDIGRDLPAASSRRSSPVPATSAPQRANGTAPRPGSLKTSPNLRHPDKRKHLIVDTITIRETNIRRVYLELKNMDLDKFPQAAVCLLRVFVEWSLDHYIEKRSLSVRSKGNQRPTLQARIKLVGDKLYAKDRIPRAHQKAIRSACNGSGGITAPDNLHMRLHSKYHFANKKDLIHIWDNVYGPLLSSLWTELQNQ